MADPSPRLPLALLLLLTVVGAQADHKADLIEQYPFYATATGRFAPVYPALARQTVEDYGITEGVCVDLGGGCGSLAMELAKITDLTVYVLDIDPAAVRLCGLLVDEAGLRGRVRPVEGRAEDLPFRDRFADLVVSRGSIFFWSDQLAGLKEAYRILRPGGVAFIGGGFSRLLDPAVKADLIATRKSGASEGGGDRQPIHTGLVDRARRAGVRPIRLLHDPDDHPDFGWWIEIRKPSSRRPQE